MHTLESQVTSVVPVVLLRAGAHEALDHFFSALYTSGSVLFPLCFPKKKSDEDENEKKQTNKQAKQTMKASLSRGSPGKLSDEIQSMLLVN